jgi:predicted heme/steroid binding protein
VDRKFTSDELAEHNGADGKPVYVAVDGKVYDVTGSKLWKTGTHMNRHACGRDLSADLGAAPHGKEVLEREAVKEVGDLIEEEMKEHIPEFLSALFGRFPILRRHPHPMMIHFPMAYLIAGALFITLDLLGAGKVAPFAQMALAMLVLAALFTPLAIITGLVTWWVNYALRPIRQVKRKIQLAVLLGFMEIVCLILKLAGLSTSGLGAGIYGALMILFVPVVVLLGYYGGHLVMPYEKK